ncbi:MAG: glycosyltransferase family 2 protein [Nocardioidaceae bacterium]
MAVSCDLVVPCRDEGPALPDLLTRVPPGMTVIVVDNGSTDDTAAVARRLGAHVVSESRPGYGAAVDAGVQASTAELVAVIDGDGTFDPMDLEPLVDAVSAGECTLAVGRRRPTSPGLVPWPARLGNSLVSRWLRHLGAPVHDIAPARVCRRADLLSLGVEDRRFGYPVELLSKAAKAGWVIREYDVSYSARADGTRSKVSGSLRGSVLAAADFVRVLT